MASHTFAAEELEYEFAVDYRIEHAPQSERAFLAGCERGSRQRMNTEQRHSRGSNNVNGAHRRGSKRKGL